MATHGVNDGLTERKELDIVNKNKQGCLSEQIAIVYFMKKGLDVFDACQTNGPVDLITFDRDTGQSQCWEVKTENYRYTGPQKGYRIGRTRRDKRFTKIINMLYVDKNGEVREGKRKN